MALDEKPLEVEMDDLEHSERIALTQAMGDRARWIVETSGLLPSDKQRLLEEGMHRLIQRGWFRPAGIDPKDGQPVFKNVVTIKVNTRLKEFDPSKIV